MVGRCTGMYFAHIKNDQLGERPIPVILDTCMRILDQTLHRMLINIIRGNLRTPFALFKVSMGHDLF
jgi:hypothetical protein